METRVVWFRRDLRTTDHPALAAAAADGARVVPLFVHDPALADVGHVRAGRLAASLSALHERTQGALVVRRGDPARVVAQVAEEAGADQVHVSAETTPFGRRRDTRVQHALDASGVRWVATGSPYAVTPGRVLNRAGEPYRVFTPFARAWREHGWRRPAEVGPVRWADGLDSEPLEAVHSDLPGAGEPVGEEAVWAHWEEFREQRLTDYDELRDRPDLDSTSRLSVPLKYGEVHPRTLLADLAARYPDPADAPGVDRFVTELAWREFYADVLFHTPGSAWQDWRGDQAAMTYRDDHAQLEAWQQGRTGFPLVDAGMRQLLAEGWMHNRVRMVTASFLTKDLHQWWPAGARHFLRHLRDGDVASNNHGWQWCAGTGTDAAPYWRILNPVTQAKRFDPDGDYVRRWVPELRHLDGAAVHEPWKHPRGHNHGYPTRMVDHAEERREALARYEHARHATDRKALSS